VSSILSKSYLLIQFSGKSYLLRRFLLTEGEQKRSLHIIVILHMFIMREGGIECYVRLDLIQKIYI
jgi:hypothetical protein